MYELQTLSSQHYLIFNQFSPQNFFHSEVNTIKKISFILLQTNLSLQLYILDHIKWKIKHKTGFMGMGPYYTKFV